MDYEKKYNEALKRAKAAIDIAADKDLVKGVASTIFPELCESEDERIRRELIEYLRGDLDDITTDDTDRWIAYLDKQKEQKPADYPYLAGWRKNRDDNKPELKRSVLMLTTHGVAEGEWLGEKWCQYRWSCGLKDDEVLYWMHLSDLVRLEKEDEQKEQKEQNPADEIKDQRQIYFMIENGRRCGVIEGRKQVIDNPEKYGLQKPAEWSEEDETIIEGACNALEIHGHTKLASMLKYIRPSWKPSEEQMNCLCAAVDAAIRKHNESVSGYEPARVLKSLYEQLKKLM